MSDDPEEARKPPPLMNVCAHCNRHIGDDARAHFVVLSLTDPRPYGELLVCIDAERRNPDRTFTHRTEASGIFCARCGDRIKKMIESLRSTVAGRMGESS